MDTESTTHDDVHAHTHAPAKSGGATRWVLAGIGVLVIVGAAYVVKSRQAAAPAAGAAQAGDRAVPISVATVTQQDIPVWLEGLGTVTPVATVNVKTLVDGPLVSVNFKEGQLVHKGDLLAQVDPRPFQIALHNAEAALTRDTAQLRDARLNLDRYRSLRTQNLIAAQQLDDQQALVDQYTGTTLADQASIESAKLNLDYSHIVSPIDGVTGVRLIDVGNIVHAADQTYILVLTQLDPIAVLFTLPEDDLTRVQLQLAKGKIPAESYSRDGQTKLATGELGLIDNEVNATTATIRLKAFFPNKDRLLWPSEFVKTRLLLSTKLGAITVPATVVQRGPNGTFAYVVGADNTVSVRPIEVDSTQGDTAILTSGLKPGERVASDGQNQLRAGAKIQPRDATKSIAATPANGSAQPSSAPPPRGAAAPSGSPSSPPAAPAGTAP